MLANEDPVPIMLLANKVKLALSTLRFQSGVFYLDTSIVENGLLNKHQNHNCKQGRS